MIHPLSDCKAFVPESTNIWQFCVILPDVKIGENCNICAHVLIENGVTLGNNVTIKSGVQLWDGIIVEDDVFIGPNATFCNDHYPRSKKHVIHKTLRLCKGSSIGAGAVILDGITIGEKSMIGAGSVVTKDIPAGELWCGNPAHFVKKINSDEYLYSREKQYCG